MDPEIKKRIEANKQEALRRLAISREKQRLQQQNQQNKEIQKVTPNQRYSPYSTKPSTSAVKPLVEANITTSPTVLQNYNEPSTSKSVDQKVQLTDEVKKRIEANRQEALRKFAMRQEELRLQQQQNKEVKKVIPIVHSTPRTPPISSTVALKPTAEAKITTNQSNNNYNPSTSKAKAVDQQQVSLPSTPKKTYRCTFSLISRSRFNAKVDYYNESIIDQFKKIPSRSYSHQTKVWSFSLKDHNQLWKELKALKIDMTIEQIPEFVLKRMLAESPRIDEMCLENIEPSLINSLLPFQTYGVLFGISRSGKVLIGDDPGLGKSRMALGIANYFKNYPMLVITNASTREFWKNEIIKVLNISDNLVEILSKDTYLQHENNYVICSYSSLESNFDMLKSMKFETVIFDESHNIKNPKAKQTLNSQKLAKSAKRIIMLTGTPALSRPVELYPQLSMLDPTFPSFHQFTLRYCNGHYTNFGYDAMGCSNLDELKIYLSETLLLRRVKSEVFTELNSKKRECVVVQDFLLSEEAKEDFEEFASICKNPTNKNDKALLAWYQYTAEVKVEAACRFLENLLSKGNEKILAFAHHVIMLNALSEHLDKLKVCHVRIDGSVSGTLRSERIANFQHNSKIRVAVLSTLATNAGITLTAASVVCFFELEFNPSTIIQAEARAHRIGQKDQVKIYFLLAPGTADDIIWNMIVKKQNNLGMAGLVDSIEFLSTNIETSKFFVKKSIEDEKKEVDESHHNDSTNTFYSCASSLSNFNEINTNNAEMKEMDDVDYNSDESLGSQELKLLLEVESKYTEKFRDEAKG